LQTDLVKRRWKKIVSREREWQSNRGLSRERTNVKNAWADTDPHRVEHTSTVAHMHRHSVVHCGLGIGLTAGKCCAERISEQGGDFGLERTGDGVAGKAGEVSQY
jgi:hypothetical protein